ncbi:MAG: nucleotidyl transferase AbiEii/AbiGii toxin family protein [Opitutaceae bacterium]|jgi:predicted nucleotidyltransferase component of viral defense system
MNDLHLRPGEFQAALDFTAAETGFSARLIEKDYWCSLMLRELFAEGDLPLVFKGGTLLSKAYVGFDRLSEDLDFSVPTGPDSARSARSRIAKQIKRKIDSVAKTLGMEWEEEWKGHNNSTQHIGRLSYPTASGSREAIIVEVGQREPLLASSLHVDLRTLLLNPLFSESVLSPIAVTALSRDEAYAEKARAALTRKEPAIRDLYDLLQGKRAGLIPLDNRGWIEMVRQKCADLDLANACSAERLERFRVGIETDLLPVLRSGAASFDLPEAWEVVEAILAKVR